jgi:hypothetical protein
MQNHHDPIVMRGIENVRRRYTLEQWVMLDVGKVTKEIYDEIRRLDLESVQTREVNGSRRLAGPKFRRPRKAVDDVRAAIVCAAE